MVWEGCACGHWPAHGEGCPADPVSSGCRTHPWERQRHQCARCGEHGWARCCGEWLAPHGGQLGREGGHRLPGGSAGLCWLRSHSWGPALFSSCSGGLARRMQTPAPPRRTRVQPCVGPSLGSKDQWHLLWCPEGSGRVPPRVLETWGQQVRGRG